MALVDWETQDKLKKQEAIIDDLRGKLATAEEQLAAQKQGKAKPISPEQREILVAHMEAHGTTMVRPLAKLLGVGATTAHRWLKAMQEDKV